jgi:hypothetical protein
MGSKKSSRRGECVNPHRLKNFEEAQGNLRSVSCQDGFGIATFEWGAIFFPEEIREELEEMVGKTVTVLRLDGNYHIRAV